MSMVKKRKNKTKTKTRAKDVSFVWSQFGRIKGFRPKSIKLLKTNVKCQTCI